MWRVVFALLFLVYGSCVVAQSSLAQSSSLKEGRGVRDASPVQLTAVQEREFMDKCAYALISNSPEVRDVISKLGADPGWHDLFYSQLMRLSKVPPELDKYQVARQDFAFPERGCAGKLILPSVAPSSESLLFNRIMSNSVQNEVDPVRPESKETLSLYHSLLKICADVRNSFDWYVQGYAGASTEVLMKQQAGYREKLVKQIGEPLVDSLDKLLNEAKSKP